MISGIFMFIARLCISGIFLYGAYLKFFFYDASFQYIASKNLPMIPVLLIGAAIVEVIGGLSLIFGYKARAGAILLILYLIPTTILFHDFWNIVEPIAKQLQTIMFLKNLAIFGGLLYIASTGAGRLACDCCSKSCHASKEIQH